jgi:hypothetical protein
VIRKAILDRTKDWLDIEAIFTASGPLDLAEIESWLRRLAAPDDARTTRLQNLAGRLLS